MTAASVCRTVHDGERRNLGARMKLADLIDLEAQLLADEGVDPEVLRQRDRALYTSFAPGATADRHRLLSAWLDGLRRTQQGAELGSAILTGQRLLAYVLVGVGLIAGAGAAAALLYYDGGAPVNVGAFLLAIVGVQVALLVGIGLSVLLSWFFREIPVVSDIRAFFRFAANAFEPALDRVARHLPTERLEQFRVARSRLRTRARLYAPVERWTLIALSQVLGIAFNVGVLVVCLRLIYFSDLAFGWSTTADALDVSTMYRWVTTLAAPWGWLFPEAVPTYELVEQSRFSRLQGGFAAGVTDSLVGQWWTFLVAAVVTYGLMPRVALWGLARALRASALAKLPLDTPDVQRVIRRLEAPRVETRAEAPPPPSAAAEATPVEPLLPPEPPPPADDEAGCVLIRWREVPGVDSALAQGVRATFGYRFGGAIEAGGTDLEADEASQRAAAAAGGPVIVMAEAWEAPDKGIRRYLKGLRTAVGVDRPIYVTLVGEGTPSAMAAPESDDVALWRDRLTLLEDPYLGVQPWEPA